MIILAYCSFLAIMLCWGLKLISMLINSFANYLFSSVKHETACYVLALHWSTEACSLSFEIYQFKNSNFFKKQENKYNISPVLSTMKHRGKEWERGRQGERGNEMERQRQKETLRGCSGMSTLKQWGFKPRFLEMGRSLMFEDRSKLVLWKEWYV